MTTPERGRRIDETRRDRTLRDISSARQEREREREREIERRGRGIV